MSFLKSVSMLDGRFFLVWLMDILFYAGIGIVYYVSYFLFGAISQNLLALQYAPAATAVVEQMYKEAYSLLGAIAAMIVVVILIYIILQAFLWSVIMRQKLSMRTLLWFALYQLLIWLFLAVPLLMILFLVFALFAWGSKLDGFVAVLFGYVLMFLAFSILMPFTVFPSYAYMKKRKVWQGIAQMFYLGFSSVPRMWPTYLLGGLVMLIVTQLYYVLLWFNIDPSLGGLLLVALLVSPVLAWYRFYIVGLLEKL